MEEVDDSSLSIDYWLDSNDNEMNFGEINVKEGEVLTDDPIGDGEPDEQEVVGPTGNEGTSIERWYRRGAVILWPKEHHFSIISQGNKENTVPQLKKMVEDLISSGENKDSEQWQQCLIFSHEIIKTWRPSKTGLHLHLTGQDYNALKEMFNVIITADNLDLIKSFLKNILVKEYTGTEGKNIISICQRYGWTTFQDELNDMIKQRRFVAFSTILEQLCSQNTESSSDRLKLCKTLSHKILSAIKEDDNNRPQQNYSERREEKDSDKIILVESLFSIINNINEIVLLEDIIEHFINQKKYYPMYKVLIPVLKKLHPQMKKLSNVKSLYSKLLKHCIAQLKDAVAVLIEKPTTWAQDISLPCKCNDCRILEAFLKDPEQQVQEFRVRKERRQHLHNQIDRHHCDMTHVTRRTGSPHTLVCTKTRASYNAKLEQRKVDNKLLEELQELMI